MIDHDRAQELAAAALDFELSPTHREALRRHLDECAACRALDERLRADARAMADLTPHDAPDGLRARILDIAAPTPASGEAAEEVPDARLKDAKPRALPTIPLRYRGPAVMAAAAAVIVALIGGMLVWRSGPSTVPDVAVASPSLSAPSVSGSAAPGSPLPSLEPLEPGSRLAASPWTPVAELTAEDAPGGVLALRSGFRLTSLNGTPAADIARRLTVEPTIEFTVTADADGRTARITPKEALTPGALYHFTLTADDGRTLDSWAFQAHQPLRVVATLPRDTETDIPLDTGIEVTFDQDGVVDAASHVTIEPTVSGRFEEHGRVLAFVPERPLDSATVYTVTVTRGVEVGGTGEILESDVHFRFETALAGDQGKAVTFQFSDDVFESATADRPTIAVWAFQDWEGDVQPAPPTSARIEVYKLRDLDAAIDTFRQVRSFPRWARRASADLVPTAGLTQIVAFDAQLRDSQGVLWFELPERLPAGWYLVMLPSATRPIQAMLQVTDIAGYLVVSETQTLVWANDLATGAPVVGATVAAQGTDLGRTGADGSLMADTPAALLPTQSGSCAGPCLPVVTVRSGDRAAFLPATGHRDPEGKDISNFSAEGEGARYWHVFDTDRTLYRRTDTVNTWGVLRDRDTGKVPAAVTIRLFAMQDEGTGGDGPPLSTAEVHPNAVGAFTGSIALDDLPEGNYGLDLSVGDDLVASSGFQVDRILKPAYRLEVTTGRRVYFQGDQVRVTARATFYEGSPVPGLPLRTEGLIDDSFVTDAAGSATLRTTVRFEKDEENIGPEVRTVQVTPARAEEGEISGASRDIVVFPSSWTIDATAQLRDGRVRVTGDLHEVDRDRLEREIAAGEDPWALDPAGVPVGGTTVTATFIEIIPNRARSGTRYDFIEKKVVPVFEYSSSERDAGTIKVRTQADGGFSVSIPASGDGHAYRVSLSATDPDSHAARWDGGADEPGWQQEEFVGASLGLTSGGSNQPSVFGVGEPIDLTMTEPNVGTGGGTDRYLFYTAQRGLRDAAFQPSPRYRTAFAAWAPPGFWITGVRFTGSGYVESPGFYADFRESDRKLTVGLATNAGRYVPGGDVTMTVITRDRTGDPVAATVVLRAVDEKLFTMGAAGAADPLGALYAGVEMGIRARYSSHRTPQSEFSGGDTGGGGGGDTGGGGDDRADFRDSVLFRTVDTGPDGRATVTFRVSDDLTSWRVSASAIGAGLLAGEASIQVPVGLPFFVDATIAPEYLVSDRPEIGLRAFGTALDAAARVTFAVDSDSLGLHIAGLHADAFKTITVPLPTLTLGSHTITITATTGSGDSARRDRLTRTFKVVGSRLARTWTAYQELTGTAHLTGGDGLNEVIVSDAGLGRYVPLLLDLADADSARLERALAAAIASSIAEDDFDIVDTVASVDFDGSRYQTPDGGLAILPYSSSDLEASALAAIIAPDRFDGPRLESYLAAIADDDRETRERRNYAIAGLAGLGASVLPEIRAAAVDPELTIRERLMLGLGAAALGDSATARSIKASLVELYGESVGDQARLRIGDSVADTAAATALMAPLAAATGDPLAPRFLAYVEANPGLEAPYGLHAVGYVLRMLEHGAPRSASFAYAIGGERKIVKLDPGGTFHMSVTEAQLASLTIEPVSGQIGVTTSWREPVKASAMKKDPDITIRRVVTPSGTIGTADLVMVDLTVELGPNAPSGCHTVTDIVPSGLLAVGNLQAWVDPNDEEAPPANATYPYAQIGQRVYFCAAERVGGGVIDLRYVARVVTPGIYTWESAIVESRTGTNRAALTEETSVEIR